MEGLIDCQLVFVVFLIEIIICHVGDDDDNNDQE